MPPVMSRMVGVLERCVRGWNGDGAVEPHSLIEVRLARHENLGRLTVVASFPEDVGPAMPSSPRPRSLPAVLHIKSAPPIKNRGQLRHRCQCTVNG